MCFVRYLTQSDAKADIKFWFAATPNFSSPYFNCHTINFVNKKLCNPQSQRIIAFGLHRDDYFFVIKNLAVY
jgi:hypothetical protein